MMIVHYYQPNHAAVNITVSIDGQSKGSVHAAYCPSISGCRAIVLFHSTGEVFENVDMRQVKFTNGQNNRDIWLDYFLLASPRNVDPETLHKTMPLKLTGDFISKCASQHFDINYGESAYCDKSAFSLAAKYNNGAQACACDPEGSLNEHECNKFGGECACKPHVIGRQCSRCESGYYGFPDCQECNCISGSCNDVTGKCDCPINVEEKSCSVCLDNYFGFHPKFGCEDCDCEVSSTLNGSNLCDKLSGQCPCTSNTDGRRCDKCKSGFYSYPACERCDCHTNGTTEAVCDPANAQCLCKKNVVGGRCDSCADDTFNLDSTNPDGCTKCFCFGQSTRCMSANLFIRKFRYFVPEEDEDFEAWSLTSEQSIDFVNDVAFNYSSGSQGLELTILNANLDKLSEPIYWKAPKPFIGNKITSYGSSIRYKIKIEQPDEATSVIRPDLVIRNANMILIHTSVQQPEDKVEFEHEVKLVEGEFTHLVSGSKVSREQLMTVLSSISEIKLRAIYFNRVHPSELVDFELDQAAEQSEDDADLDRPALSAERCGCPPTYRGYSCESCEYGYYKVKSNGPGLFNCIKCHCNGHASTCDQENGKCLECQGNTEGDNCEKCKRGYHKVNTEDGGFECRLCPCPGSSEANVFADSCTYNAEANIYSCQCQPGYTGQFCQRCEAGFYGKQNYF